MIKNLSKIKNVTMKILLFFLIMIVENLSLNDTKFTVNMFNMNYPIYMVTPISIYAIQTT